MRKMRAIGIICLFVFMLPNHVSAQSTENEHIFTAIVRGSAAEFAFSLPEQETWTWNRKETEDNYLEYAWQVSLTGNDLKGTYNFGVYLFKYPHSNEISGSIDELIYRAQASIFDKSLNVRDDLSIKSFIQDKKLIIKISDKKTFSELFLQHPTIAHCRVRTPYANANYVRQIQIEFK